jgi:diadenosine tetraphosphatase ApaH/serine/threonine PP2A family protein phosphatase
MKPYEARGKLALIREDFGGKLIVAGDIHGDFRAFGGIRKIFEKEPDSLLIFLGDYADRGEKGLEVIEGVQELMKRHKEHVIALKGNHEDYRDGVPYFSPWDLDAEVRAKKRMGWEEFFPNFERDFLNRLFLAALVPGVMLCVHGGVSPRLRRVRDLENPSRGLEEDLLWSDPWEGPGERPNPRGAGILFGPEISEEVLAGLGVKFNLRGHEPRKAFDGPCVEHGGRVFTCSSTGVYGGRAFALVFRPHRGLGNDELAQSVKYL